MDKKGKRRDSKKVKKMSEDQDFKDAMKKVYGGSPNKDNAKESQKEGKSLEFEEAMKKIYSGGKIIKDQAKKIEENVIDESKEPDIVKEVKEFEQKLNKEIENKDKGDSKEKTEEKEEKTEKPKKDKEEPKQEISSSGLNVSPSPHIKDKETTSRIMWAVVISLIPAAIAGVYFFGISAFWIIILASLSAVSTEFIIYKLTKKEIAIMDGSSLITGLLLALVLPPTVPLWIPIVGSAFAIAIGKMVFGGLGHNIFNPALVGRAFLVVSFPALMTRWILPDGITGATPLGLWKLQGITTSYSSLFMGNIGGCIGETSALALLIGAAFLFYKKIISWKIPTAFIGSVALVALIFGQDPLFHILSGGLFIGAFFMATDYVTTPLTGKGKLIFGLGCGILTMIFRLFASYPEGVMFAILLMNTATPLIDRFTKTMPFGYISTKKQKIQAEEEEIKKKVSEMLKKKNETG